MKWGESVLCVTSKWKHSIVSVGDSLLYFSCGIKCCYEGPLGSKQPIVPSFGSILSCGGFHSQGCLMVQDNWECQPSHPQFKWDERTRGKGMMSLSAEQSPFSEFSCKPYHWAILAYPWLPPNERDQKAFSLSSAHCWPSRGASVTEKKGESKISGMQTAASGMIKCCLLCLLLHITKFQIYVWLVKSSVNCLHSRGCLVHWGGEILMTKSDKRRKECQKLWGNMNKDFCYILLTLHVMVHGKRDLKVHPQCCVKHT